MHYICEKLLQHTINRVVTNPNCSHALFAIFIQCSAAHKFGKFLFLRSTNAAATPLAACIVVQQESCAHVKLIRLMRQLSAAENLHRVFSSAVCESALAFFRVAQKVQLSEMLDSNYLSFLQQSTESRYN